MATSYQLTKGNLITASRLTVAAVKKTVTLARESYQWEIKLEIQGRIFGVYFTNGYKYREYCIREHLNTPEPWKQSFHEARVHTADEAVCFIINLF